MIVFAANLGVLNPSGCGPVALDEVLSKLGVGNVTADVHDFIVRCAGGDVPYVLRDGSGRMRSVGEVLQPAEMLSIVANDEWGGLGVPVLAAAGGSWFAVDQDGRVWANLVNPDGSARRHYVQVASSFEAFAANLELDEGLLDDMVEYAVEDGFPDRTSDIADLRREAGRR